MLDDKSDYKLVTEAEIAGCPINGSIKPLSCDLVCRGEDILFLTEAFREIKTGWLNGRILEPYSEWSVSSTVLLDDIPANDWLSADPDPSAWVSKRNLVRQAGNALMRSCTPGFEGERDVHRLFMDQAVVPQRYSLGCLHGADISSVQTGWAYDIDRSLKQMGQWEDSPFQHALETMRKQAGNLKGWLRPSYSEEQARQQLQFDYGSKAPLKLSELVQFTDVNGGSQPEDLGVYDILRAMSQCVVRVEPPMTEFHKWEHYKTFDTQTWDVITDETWDRGEFRNPYHLNSQYEWRATRDDVRHTLAQDEQYQTPKSDYSLGCDLLVANPEFRQQIDNDPHFVPVKLIQTYGVQMMNAGQATQEFTDAWVGEFRRVAKVNEVAWAWSVPELPTVTDAASTLKSYHRFTQSDYNCFFRVTAKHSFVLFDCDWRWKWW